MLLLEVDEVPPALAEVSDQLVLFVLYFVKDSIIVNAVHDLLIDPHLLGLHCFELLPLSEVLLSSEESFEVLDAELQLLHEVFWLIFVGSIADKLICQEEASVLILSRDLVAGDLQVVHELLVVAIVLEMVDILLKLL